MPWKFLARSMKISKPSTCYPRKIVRDTLLNTKSLYSAVFVQRYRRRQASRQTMPGICICVLIGNFLFKWQKLFSKTALAVLIMVPLKVAPKMVKFMVVSIPERQKSTDTCLETLPTIFGSQLIPDSVLHITQRITLTYDGFAISKYQLSYIEIV